jgi:hypothetical protein
MTTHTIPNIDNSTDTTIAITKAEAKWIKANMPEVELALVGWLDRLYPADVMAAVTQDLRWISGCTQATRTRLKRKQLIHTDTDPMSLEASLQRWHLTPLLQEHLDATRANVLGGTNLITVKLERTSTVWKIAPLYFNQFRRRLIELAPTKPKTIKLPALKSSPEWSFTPATT